MVGKNIKRSGKMALSKKPVTGMKDILPEEMKIRNYVQNVIKDTYCLLYTSGYGINEKLIKNAYDSGIDTILTCDNGISAYNQVEYAKSLGMNIIITDHHEVPFEETDGKREYIVPNADAVVNHKQADCPYPFKELCGAMVAYQLISALFETRCV